MYSKEVVIKNQVGLHARPASYFIQRANDFKEEIKISKDEREVYAKSLLGVLSLGITRGSSVTISAVGENEEAAVEALVQLIESNFE